MSDSDNFVGFWKVLNCSPVSVNIDLKGIQGTIFQLSNTGDVTWKIPEGAVPSPLFKCDTYEIGSKNPCLMDYEVRFGAYKGNIINCTLRICERYNGLIRIGDGCCWFYCKKLNDLNLEDPVQLPFSFLPALQDGYFSDLIIKANSSKEFKVHTCILKLGLPEVDWSSKPTPLSDLSEDVIFAILHFLYAQCLPTGLKESTVENIISAASQIPGLHTLVSLCHIYIRNMTLKKKIFSLVSDIHTCASQIIEYFTNKQSTSSFNNLASDPAKLCFAIKNSIQEIAVAASKLLMICDLYSKQKNELSKEEINEIILHAKSKLPVFMNLLETFLKAVKTNFCDLLPSQRQELACYLVPEIETICDTISSLLTKMKTFLEIIRAEYELEEKTNSQKNFENLEQYTDSVLHSMKFYILLRVIDFATGLLLGLHQKKENFKLMTNGNKIRCVARFLEQLMEDLFMCVLRVEEFTSALDEKLHWNKSQFWFKVGTSKFSGVLRKFIEHKESLQDLLAELCSLVQRDSFSQSLVALGLLDSPFTTAVSSSENIPNPESVQAASSDNSQMLNLKDCVCVPPPAPQNHLSEAASELLKLEEETDMVFEIITSHEPEDVLDQPEAGTSELELEPKTSVSMEVHKMPAHRVIVASRCDWFRRALLSGMQEDINRKIEVHNTSPDLFSLFLKYLYSGRVDCLTLSVDHISELLLLSDRYELDSLKQVCEYGLKPHLDADSVLYFYNMADRFNAKILKSSCEQFIAEHPDIIDGELFEELPDNLQSEVYDIVICGKPQNIDLPLDKLFPNISCLIDFEEMIADDHINSNLPTPDSDDSPLSQDLPRLKATLEQLREIVGHEVPRSQLVEVILAADYDVNRALNFYYSSS